MIRLSLTLFISSTNLFYGLLFANSIVLYQSGEIIDGVEAETGRISRNVPWRCRYEQALIQPAREVLDIEAGEFASGPRKS